VGREASDRGWCGVVGSRKAGVGRGYAVRGDRGSQRDGVRGSQREGVTHDVVCGCGVGVAGLHLPSPVEGQFGAERGASLVDTGGADCPAFTDLLDETVVNTGAVPKQTLADAGYFSADNVAAAHELGTEAFIATGRRKRGEQVGESPRGRIPKNATPKQRMARKLRTKKGRAAYARRKVIVEPVFGQMKTTQLAGRLLLRGHDNALAEWRLLAACHNVRKLFQHRGTAGLAAA